MRSRGCRGSLRSKRSSAPSSRAIRWSPRWVIRSRRPKGSRGLSAVAAVREPDVMPAALPMPRDASLCLARRRDRRARGGPRLTARCRAVADRTARADRPLVLAGDCLTAVGILAGVQRRRGNLSIIWLDAHGDFNTPEISVSGYSPECPWRPRPVASPNSSASQSGCGRSRTSGAC